MTILRRRRKVRRWVGSWL